MDDFGTSECPSFSRVSAVEKQIQRLCCCSSKAKANRSTARRQGVWPGLTAARQHKARGSLPSSPARKARFELRHTLSRKQRHYCCTVPKFGSMAATELSELRAELWRTRDDLERMKSRGTPPSAERSPRRLFDRRLHSSKTFPAAAATAAGEGRRTDRSTRRHWHESSVAVADKRRDTDRNGSDSGEGGGGIRSGSTSPPTSGDSSPGSDADNNDRSHTRVLGATRTPDGGRIRASPSPADRKHRTYRGASGSSGEDARRGSPEEAAAEETLCNLELEGAAFKNWTEEASSIAVRLIEEVKMLRWEKASWQGRQRAAEREAEHAAAELRARADLLEERLRSVEEDRRKSQAALARAQQDADNERARAKMEREKADRLRAAAAAQQETERIQHQQQQQQHVETAGGGLAEMLRREKEGADALQRRLDAARTASARHERERKEWRSSRARLEELRRSWGKQLKRVGG